MRISDWSSDVCSSDLRAVEADTVILLHEEHYMNDPLPKKRSITVMVGLPHLADGKLLERARRLQQPVLISANAPSRWTKERGWRAAERRVGKGWVIECESGGSQGTKKKKKKKK